MWSTKVCCLELLFHSVRMLTCRHRNYQFPQVAKEEREEKIAIEGGCPCDGTISCTDEKAGSIRLPCLLDETHRSRGGSVDSLMTGSCIARSYNKKHGL
jgi:hypothetical protein